MTGPRAIPPREQIWRSWTEKYWTSWVAETARGFGWERFHPYLSIKSPRGWPDEVYCRPPRLILAELKTMTGKLSERQEHWRALLEACPGVEMYVWRPSQQDEVIRILAPEGRRIRF